MAIINRQGIFNLGSQGKGLTIPFLALVSGATTAAAAASGQFTAQFLPNNLGSTAYSAIQGFPEPAGMPNPTRLTGLIVSTGAGSTSGTYTLARAYKAGTLNLAATGDQFTADAATFPILKTQMGAASTAMNLIPLLLVTTATTTTAAIFTLKTAAGGTGYVNQANANVVGTKTFTMPNVATALGSAFILKLEDGDSSVRKISAIQVNTAASAGAASIYLIESLATVGIAGNGAWSGVRNMVFNPPSIPNLSAGAATSGTATAPLVLIRTSSQGNTATANGFIKAYTE